MDELARIQPPDIQPRLRQIRERLPTVIDFIRHCNIYVGTKWMYDWVFKIGKAPNAYPKSVTHVLCLAKRQFNAATTMDVSLDEVRHMTALPTSDKVQSSICLFVCCFFLCFFR